VHSCLELLLGGAGIAEGAPLVEGGEDEHSAERREKVVEMDRVVPPLAQLSSIVQTLSAGPQRILLVTTGADFKPSTAIRFCGSYKRGMALKAWSQRTWHCSAIITVGSEQNRSFPERICSPRMPQQEKMPKAISDVFATGRTCRGRGLKTESTAADKP
jgi:hypothetical protein